MKRLHNQNNVEREEIDVQGQLDSYALKLNFSLVLMTVVPAIVLSLTELRILDKNHLPFWFHIRVFDLLDFMILAPFWTLILLRIRFIIRDFNQLDSALKLSSSSAFLHYLRSSHGGEQWFDLVTIIGFLYGNAIHFSADTIHSYVNEVNDYEAKLPRDLYNLIYFMDEDLGHWILFASLFGLFGFWTVISNIQSLDLSPSKSDGHYARFLKEMHGSLPALITGTMMGFSFSLAVIEGGSVWIGFVASVYLISCSLWKLFHPKSANVTKSHHGNGTPYNSHNGTHEVTKKNSDSATSNATTKLIVKSKRTGEFIFVNFSLAFACAMLFGLSAYYLLLGEFFEPSKIGGINGIFKIAQGRFLPIT